MGNMQRDKGQRGEREVAGLLRDWLGMDITRNWQQQSAEGGADLTGIPGWAVEVKFADTFLSAWWRQTVAQAERAGAAPVLIYRLTGAARGRHILDKWRVVVRIADLSPLDIDPDETAEISLRAWMAIVREHLSAAAIAPDGPESAQTGRYASRAGHP
jgi:hypothetical protein